MRTRSSIPWRPRLPFSHEHDVVVIGAGHAGLATSYHMLARGVPHVVLERDSIGSTWRRQRWDSFTLVTPNWSLDLPGFAYDGAHPDGFLPRDEVVAHLERYAARYRLPVDEGTEVSRIQRTAGEGYLLTTDRGPLTARSVVVAVGVNQRPKIPAVGRDLPPALSQLHASEYLRPEALPPGAVLVVGTGQSGCQIAEELHEAGRNVFLSAGTTGRAPRRYRGRDLTRWMADMGMLDQPVEALASTALRFAANPHVSGTRGGHTINLHRLARDGVTLVGRLMGMQGSCLRFAADVRANLAAADAFADGIRRAVDDYVRERDLEAPPADPNDDHGGGEGFRQATILQLDPATEGIGCVVWATGFAFDYRWIELPGLVDGAGYPRQVRGVSEYDGLYFVGLRYQTRASSDLFVGVGQDASDVAERIAAQQGGTAAGGDANGPGLKPRV